MRHLSLALTLAALISAPMCAQNSQVEAQLKTAWAGIEPIGHKEKKTAADLAEVQNVIRLANSLIVKYPDSSNVYLLKGNAMLLFKKVDAHALLQLANRAVKLAPNNADAYHLRGRAYRLLNRNAEALKDWHKAAVDLKLSESAVATGAYYEDCRDYKQAFSWYSLASKLSPKDPKPYFRTGVCLIDTQEYASASQNLEKAVSLTPKPQSNDEKKNVAWMYHLIAECHGNQGQFQEAITAFNAELAIDPGKIDEYYLRAKTYSSIGQYKKALEDLAVCIPGQPEEAHRAYLLRATIYRRLHRLDEAIKDCTASIKVASKDPDAFELRGDCLADKKQFSAALADMDQASRREPYSHKALTKKAYIQEMMGDKAGAAKTLAQTKDFDDELAPSSRLGK